MLVAKSAEKAAAAEPTEPADAPEGNAGDASEPPAREPLKLIRKGKEPLDRPPQPPPKDEATAVLWASWSGRARLKGNRNAAPRPCSGEEPEATPERVPLESSTCDAPLLAPV